MNLRPIRPRLHSQPLSQKPSLRKEERREWRESRKQAGKLAERGREKIQRGKEGRKDKRGISECRIIDHYNLNKLFLLQ